MYSKLSLQSSLLIMMVAVLVGMETLGSVEVIIILNLSSISSIESATMFSVRELQHLPDTAALLGLHTLNMRPFRAV